MYGQGQFLNRKPNLKQYNYQNNRQQDDDDDDFQTNSFTRSKVDDDDEKFNKQQQDSDFLDILMKKKKETKTPLKQPSQSPSISEQLKTGISNPSTPPQSDKEQKNLNDYKSPAQKQQVQTSQTPQPPTKPTNTPQQQTPQPSKVNTPQVQKTPQIQKTPTQINVSKQAPPTIQTPEPRLPVLEQAAELEETPKSQIKKPIVIPRNVQSQMSNDLDTIPEEELKPEVPLEFLNRPQYVRRGKNTEAVKQICLSIKSYSDDDLQKIQAIEPRNHKEVSRALTFKFYPQSEFTDVVFTPFYNQIYQKTQADVEFKRIDLGRSFDTHSCVDPNDIQPGIFARNLMNALSASAERPFLYQRILEDQALSDIGFYYVRLCVDGVWKYIVLDDFMAYQENKNLVTLPSLDDRVKALREGQPGYQSEIWPFLVEKGLAKAYGSYEDMSFGHLTSFIQSITGAPTFEYTIDGDTFQIVQPSFVGVVRGLKEYPFGLNYVSHDEKQITLRNPWGSKTPNKQQSQDGELKFNINDLLGQRLVVSHYYPDYYTISHGVRQPQNSYSAYELTFDKDTNFFITLFQKDERFFRNNINKSYKYSFANIFLFQHDPNEPSLVEQASGNTKELTIESVVTPGIYYLIITLDWEAEYDCSFQYYGSNPIKIKRVELRNDPNLFARLIAPKATQDGNKKGSVNKVDEFQWKVDNLTIYSWKYTGKDTYLWKKDLNKISDRSSQIPLTFISPKDTQQTKKLNQQQVIELRNKSFQEAKEVEIEFKPNGYHAVVVRQK